MITIVDNEEMKISVSDNFTYFKKTPDGRPLSDYIIEYTKNKFDLFRKLFNVKKLEKISFELFDNIDEWKKIYIERFKNNPPEYSRGYFVDDINLSSCIMCSNPKYNSRFWVMTLCTNAHEAFHLYYKKYIYGEDRIVWFDEGMAQFLSGEYEDLLNNEEEFNRVFIDFCNNYIPINNFNDRIQGNNSVPDNLIFKRQNVFDGYIASFLCINYLNDAYGFDYLVYLMKDNKKIRELGKTVINDMIKYFSKKNRINL